jgi:hypothetical protein
MPANIYLHYVLDLWLTKVVKKRSRGYVEIIRYADDFVICAQYKDEAETILRMLEERLGKLGLELAEDKTRIVAFGRFAEENAKKKGKKPGAFNFLGFTHFCTKSRKDKFKVGRRTDRSKFIAKVREMNKWLKSIRNAVRISEWCTQLVAKLRGHYQYYGVSENSNGINRYHYLVRRLVYLTTRQRGD